MTPKDESQAESSRRAAWAKATLWSALIAAIAAGLFIDAMCSPLCWSSDEDMYITASVLSGSRSLYADFAYLQTPYLPLLYSKIFWLFGTTHFLLTGRILSFVLAALSGWLVYLIGMKLSGRRYIALLVAIGFVFNLQMMSVMSHVWNAALAVPVALGGFYLFLRKDKEATPCGFRYLISGLLLGLAVGVKLYYVAVVAAVVLASPFYFRGMSWRTRLRSALVPFAAGVVVALLPIGYYLFACPRQFVFDNVTYHRLNTQWRADTDYDVAMTPRQKLSFLAGKIEDPTIVAAAAMVVFLFLVCGLRGRRGGQGESAIQEMFSGDSLLCAATVVVSAAALLLATPLWPHYLAMPLSFVAALSAAWCGIAARRGGDAAVAVILACVALVAVFCGGMRIAGEFQAFRDPNEWTPMAIHRTAEKIRGEMAARHLTGKIASLSPLHAVEGAIPLYKQFATGNFMYRIGDFLSEDERRLYVATSPETVKSLLERDPPDAVLVDRNAPPRGAALERPLKEFAEKRHYLAIKMDKVVLYLRPSSGEMQESNGS